MIQLFYFENWIVVERQQRSKTMAKAEASDGKVDAPCLLWPPTKSTTIGRANNAIWLCWNSEAIGVSAFFGRRQTHFIHDIVFVLHFPPFNYVVSEELAKPRLWRYSCAHISQLRNPKQRIDRIISFVLLIHHFYSFTFHTFSFCLFANSNSIWKGSGFCCCCCFSMDEFASARSRNWCEHENCGGNGNGCCQSSTKYG